jgi:hypothetical protein
MLSCSRHCNRKLYRAFQNHINPPEVLAGLISTAADTNFRPNDAGNTDLALRDDCGALTSTEAAAARFTDILRQL